jgi:drug/metabolite transporter (DMT)-like permease
LVSISAEAPLTVAFYRLLLSLPLLGVPLLYKPTKSRFTMGMHDFGLCIVSGLFLALHFGFWFTSLNYTSVASSTVLVTTFPLMILLYEYFFRGERVRTLALAGLLLALVGTALVGWGDFQASSDSLFGDLLALLGAATVGGYFLIGRHVRPRVNVLLYSVLVYGTAALGLLTWALIAGQPLTGIPPQDWWILFGLAVFPTVFGHTLFNWALRYLPATVVSVSVLGEPIGASFLAWILWLQVPGTLSLAGSAVILCGIALFLLHANRHAT